MFYSQFILAKKGPLGTIWIAAHLDRKLRRNQVTETNISMSVDSILFPEVPIALRLSGHLLLGVVRIYSRKVNYLFHDCSEALIKIKQAFHSGMVDLPPEAATAPFHSITLPETFDLDEFELLPDRESSFLANSSVNHHVTAREQITLQDPLDDSVYLDSQFGLDERFADSDAARIGLDFDEDLLFEKSSCREPSPAPTTLVEDAIPPTPADDALDVQMIPMTPADDALDFQRMGYDDQHEPATPALAPDMMDLSDNHESSTSALGVVDMELEDRIEASTTVQTLEALGLTETESEQLASKDPELVENIQSPVELREENLEMLTTVELPSREVLRNEHVHEHERLKPAQVLEDVEIKTFKELLSLEKVRFCEENLETEKLRSVVECKEQQPDSPFDVKEHTVKCDHMQEIANEDVTEIPDERREESISKTTNDIEMQGVEKVQLIEETPIRDYSSSFLPRPSPYSAPSTVQFPDDNDVLATILGKGTPIRIAPTPSETPAPKRHKSAPKPSARKRKPVLDNSMVLHGDLMRQQQENTSDIRRIRKKAPCTVHEIWAMQKEAHGQQAFYEPSFTGLSEEIQELYRRLFGLGGAKLSPASCMAYVPNHEVAHDVTVGKTEAEGNFGDGISHRKGNADALVQITETALPKLVEAESLDADVVHSEARANEPEHKQIPSKEPINTEAAVNDLQAACPDSVVESSGSEPVLDSPLAIKEETVPAMDAGQPSKGVGKDVIVQVDGEVREKEEDILVRVGSSSECTRLVEVVKEDAHKLENDRTLSSETLSVDDPTTLLSDSQNIASEIEKNFALGLTNQDNYEEATTSVQEGNKEHKNLLQDTKEETQELVQEGKQTELPLQEAKKEAGLPTHEASTEHELPFQDKNKETYMQLEVSQMQFSKESKNCVQEFSKESQEAMQVEDNEASQQEPKKESPQEFDKEAQAVVQIETRESQQAQDEQVLMLESEASTLIQPKDEASAEVLEFLGDTDYADNDDFYDEGDDFDDMPENDPEMNAQNNSGWSVRTRAVCQYLRSTFQALDTNSKNLEEAGAVKLGIEKLLVGKTRKEAARMFFETLVLKTKDYVDVQQAKPYDDIKIFPRAKLMKTEI